MHIIPICLFAKLLLSFATFHRMSISRTCVHITETTNTDQKHNEMRAEMTVGLDLEILENLRIFNGYEIKKESEKRVQFIFYQLFYCVLYSITHKSGISRANILRANCKHDKCYITADFVLNVANLHIVIT